jgi:protein-disulfide isomerase
VTRDKRRTPCWPLHLASALSLIVLAQCRSAEPQVIDLPGVGYDRGKADARVVILEFADFACTACAAFARETLPQVQRDWIETGRARLRIVPFDPGGVSRGAARAAECAARQQAFWPMHDVLFEHQKDWLGRRGQIEIFARWAADLGIDPDAFRQCWASEAARRTVDGNSLIVRSYRVPGTPAFVINGRALVGALPYGEFAAALDSALLR